MKHTLRTILALVPAVCLTVAAHAGEDTSKSSKNVIEQPPADPKFYLSLTAGGEFDEHATKFISNGVGSVAGLPLPTTVSSRDFTAVHDPGVINGNLDAGYKITDFFSVFTGFTYSHADGDEHSDGRVSDPFGLVGPVGGRYELRADVNQYEAFTGRAGFTLKMPRTILDLIHAPKAITPYFSASAGGKYVKAQHAQFLAGNFLDERVSLYDNSWVFTGQVNLGYEYMVSKCFSVTFESGYGYDTKPDRSDDRLHGVTGVNDGGDRFYSTVSLGGLVRF